MQIDRNRAKQFLKGSSCLHVHFRIELNDNVIMDFLADTVTVVRLSRHLIKSHQLSQYWPKRLGDFLRLQLRVTYIDLEMAPKKGTKRAAEAWRN